VSWLCCSEAWSKYFILLRKKMKFSGNTTWYANYWAVPLVLIMLVTLFFSKDQPKYWKAAPIDNKYKIICEFVFNLWVSHGTALKGKESAVYRKNRKRLEVVCRECETQIEKNLWRVQNITWMHHQSP
jgi:hypothetical protein